MLDFEILQTGINKGDSEIFEARRVTCEQGYNCDDSGLLWGIGYSESGR